MTKENIRSILQTMREFQDVHITQVFTKGETDWLHVKCKTGTSTLELTYLQTEAVHYYESVDAAAEVIDQAVTTVSAP
ncbi:hypothetical protein [Planococcus halotolerans]|uniref:Uncharacterized protein n=2 Tax=Planococcus halotolerans TaxID=2233542 RepID=A0A365KVS0_9BACL|nr:hypothetical protein [Planococcus halotolerans]QHJ71339.1 hypothetical protein DNR44_012200 [Planococcus halotolerans]RAZ76805.1 hypothetical protein DP120_12315 [Planococcus halotolerans]